MFKIENLTKIFKLDKSKIIVFSGLDFTINRGDWVSLTGSSGCGKTTLLHLLGGLDKPTYGKIFFEGKSFASLSPRKRALIRRKKIGFIFQNFNLMPEFSALENVVMPAVIAGSSRSKADKRGAELLAKVGLGDRLDHRPAELSGGEQQRVAIARALMQDPELILADEPTGNLDDENTIEVMEILKKLHEEDGKTIVMVTHQHHLEKYASRSLFLRGGEITES